MRYGRDTASAGDAALGAPAAESAFAPGTFARALDALAFAADAFALSEREGRRPHDAPATSTNASAAVVQQAPRLRFFTSAVRVQGRCRMPHDGRVDEASADFSSAGVLASVAVRYGLRNAALHV